MASCNILFSHCFCSWLNSEMCISHSHAFLCPPIHCGIMPWLQNQHVSVSNGVHTHSVFVSLVQVPISLKTRRGETWMLNWCSSIWKWIVTCHTHVNSDLILPVMKVWQRSEMGPRSFKVRQCVFTNLTHYLLYHTSWPIYVKAWGWLHCQQILQETQCGHWLRWRL